MRQEDARDAACDPASLSTFASVEDLLVSILMIRRSARYRELLVEGTGLDGGVLSMRVLRAVSEIGKTSSEVSVSDVADRLFIEHSNASRAVDQVAARGLLVKRPSSLDRRRVVVAPSPQGERVISDLNSRRTAVHSRMIKHWDPQDILKLEELLAKLHGAYEDVTRFKI